MKDLRLIIDEKELSYDKLIQIREHAKGYNDASDKKCSTVFVTRKLGVKLFHGHL